MAKKNREEEPCGSWMDTYGDMVTLLLTFFVMLFSMSSVNEEKFAVLVKAFTSQDPNSVNIILDQQSNGENNQENYPLNRGDGKDELADKLSSMSIEELQSLAPKDFNELYEFLKAYAEKNNMQDSVQIKKQADGCVLIRFQDNALFGPDSPIIKRESRPVLDFLGSCIKSVEDQVMLVNINGHTADPKVGSDDVSAWRLSGERASSVAIYLEDEKQVDPKKLLMVGYGKNRPIADNNTEEGLARNRRVDILIISNDNALTDQELLSALLNGAYDDTLYPDYGGVKDVLVPQSAPQSTTDQAADTFDTQPQARQPDMPPPGES